MNFSGPCRTIYYRCYRLNGELAGLFPVSPLVVSGAH